MKKYLVYLKNGGVLEEIAKCIIVRNDCLGGNVVNFMKSNGYSSLSQKDIRAIFEYKDGAVTYNDLVDVIEMNIDEFINFQKNK